MPDGNRGSPVILEPERQERYPEQDSQPEQFCQQALSPTDSMNKMENGQGTSPFLHLLQASTHVFTHVHAHLNANMLPHTNTHIYIRHTHIKVS